MTFLLFSSDGRVHFQGIQFFQDSICTSAVAAGAETGHAGSGTKTLQREARHSLTASAAGHLPVCLMCVQSQSSISFWIGEKRKISPSWLTEKGNHTSWLTDWKKKIRCFDWTQKGNHQTSWLTRNRNQSSRLTRIRKDIRRLIWLEQETRLLGWLEKESGWLEWEITLLDWFGEKNETSWLTGKGNETAWLSSNKSDFVVGLID